MKMFRHLYALFLFFVLILALAPPATATDEVKVDIYIHEYCPECSKYIDELKREFTGINGVAVEVKPIISGRNRPDLERIYSTHGVADELKGHPTIVINDHTILVGQVDIKTVLETVRLAKKQVLPRIVVYKYRLDTYKVVDLSGSDDRIYLGEISDSENTIIPVLREMNFHGLKPLMKAPFKSSSPVAH